MIKIVDQNAWTIGKSPVGLKRSREATPGDQLAGYIYLHFTHKFFLRGSAPYPAGGFQHPQAHIPPAGLLATFGAFDVTTFKISRSFLITTWQLCNTLSFVCVSFIRTL